jgi:hypothetical protein
VAGLQSAGGHGIQSSTAVDAADRRVGQLREILDLVCLNRAMGDVNLVTQKRKPFDVIAERLKNENSRGDRI